MNNNIDNGGSAFPCADTVYPDGQVQYGSFGMSLRDWFAGMALQGLWGKTLHEDENHSLLSWHNDVYDSHANHCYDMADAMISARRETP